MMLAMKCLPVLFALSLVLGYVSAASLIHTSASKASEASVNHLRSMASRSKRASFAVLPGRLRYEEGQHRFKKIKFGDFE